MTAILLALVLALACGVEDESSLPVPDSPSASTAPASPVDEPTRGSPQEAAPSAIHPVPSVSAQAASAPTEPEAPPAASPPLDALLRLPAPIAESHVGRAGSEDATRAEPGESSEGRRKNARVGIQIDRQKDPMGFDPSRSPHSQTDAGVSVSVDEKTKVRGGVRVEQEDERGREEPVPTIGIEQRF